MNRDVFLSILTMDSYNRGYAENVTLPKSNFIGNAVVVQQSDYADTCNCPLTFLLRFGAAHYWCDGRSGTRFHAYELFGRSDGVGSRQI